MKKFLVLSLIVSTSLFASENPAKLEKLANTVLSKVANDAAIVAAIKAQNAKGVSLETIKQQDEKWMKTAGYDDFMKSLMNNNCAKYLTQLAKTYRYITEAFAMDEKGANVCMIDKTSDYWQGDEDKHKKSYAGGKGAVFVDKVKFDESTQIYAAQVSVPVFSGAKAIGAVTFGVNVEEVK